VQTRERAIVALGSNVGDREAFLARGRDGLAALPRTTLEVASRVEETDPIGPVPQGRFLNQMVLLSTALTPRELLDACLELERQTGRVRGERWGPRTLDLDIVRYGEREIHEPGLVVPHPEFPHRDFWQRELAELERLVPQQRHDVED
jgi:2-amino-4-hydroxy-6-hydroxymethyldihydropteridine diphosphokinase